LELPLVKVTKQLNLRMSEMKDKILELAVQILRIGGYEALNFGTISEQLNISRANIHYHFKSKENLALEAVNRYMLNVENKFEDLGRRHAGDCHTIFQSLDDELWMNLTEDEYQGFCMCLNIVVGQIWIPQNLKERAVQHFEHLVKLFETVIRDGQASGLISERSSAEDLAREAMLVHFGIAQLAIILPKEREAGSFSRRYMKLWLDRLLEKPK
jgi:TetR/AcrR family transcriptional regulator, transcriptional repressor for nem operon